MQLERRSVAVDDTPGVPSLAIEERDGESPKIRGMAPPWNSLSVDLGGFREQFAPTAFDKLLTKKRLDVPLLFNHNDSKVLARTTNGTLRISKTDRGLEYEADPVDTPTASEVLTLIRTRSIFGSSFAFTVDPKGEAWAEDERGKIVRTIIEASGLYDLSPVTRAAYSSSSVSARSLELWSTARAAATGGLTISLDFDRTFTAAPGLWRSFIADAVSRGNGVVCITRREDNDENRTAVRSAFGDAVDALAAVVLCGPATQKRDAAAAAGITVDIWIDDSPEKIPAAEPRKLRASTAAGAKAAAAAAVMRMRIPR